MNLKTKPFNLSDEDIKWVKTTKDSMSIEEKLEQLFFPIGYSANENYLQNEILNHKPGGMMFRSGGKDEIYQAYSYLQKHTKVPMFLAANLEAGGDGLITEGTSFGKQMQVAATNEPNEAFKLGLVSCKEAKAVGCNYAFAPVVDIDMNYHNPITNVRTFGSDKNMVKTFALEYMKAAKECEMAISIKHFPGDGVDEVDQHISTSVNSMSCTRWDETYGDVYRTLIDAGALTVMAGHIAMPAYQKKFNKNHSEKLMPATLSKELLQNLLRKQLNFNGMIITDATPMVGFLCAMDRQQAVPYCIEAGCDMILFNKDYEEDLKFMKEGFEKGILSKERLEEAITRILATKASLRLHVKQNDGTLIPSHEDMRVIGCEEHKQWAQQCADKSITLVKDVQGLLPITQKKYKRILFEIVGGCSSENRIIKHFFELMEKEGFEMTAYQKEEFDFSKPMKFESVTEFRNKYDLVIYIGNVENTSNKTTNRIDWYAPFGAGNNIPWFVEVVPTMFISLQNPYHLLDVPMIKTYINAYSNHNVNLDILVDKITGKSEFKGVSPVDPFCGKEYLAY